MKLRSLCAKISLLLFILLGPGLFTPFIFTAKADYPAHLSLQLKWYHQFQFAGYYAAVENGYYREAGLEVELREARPGLDLIGELVSGRVDYLVDGPRAVLARVQNKPVVALSAVFQHSPLVLVAGKEAGILSPANLVGKRLMIIPESDTEVLAMLRNEGVRSSSLEKVPHTWELDDLMEGRVDAMSAYLTDVPFILENVGFSHTILRPLTYGIDFYGDALYTTELEIARHPARVRAFREASLRGWDYAMRHPENIVDLILDKYSTRLSRDALLFEAQVMRQLILPHLVEIGHMNPGRWRHIAETYSALDMMPADFSLDGFLYSPDAPPFWTPRRLQWLIALGIGSLVLALCLLYFNRLLLVEVQARTRELSLSNTELKIEIAERRKSTEALMDSELRFRALVDNIPGAVYRCALDGDWTVEFISDAILDLTGYPALDFLPPRKRGLRDLIVTKKIELLDAKIRDSLERRRPCTLEYRIRRADGSTRWIYDKSVGIYAASGAPLYRDGLMLDITDRKQAEDMLKQVDGMKNEFISIAAHELRTPLTSIIGYAECLLNPGISENLDDRQKSEFMGEILAKGEALAGIIDDLLDISRMERGEPLRMTRAPCDLPLLVDKVVREFQMGAPRHHFETRMESVAPASLWLDQNRVVQVFENILSNAVKYSAQGGRIEIVGLETDGYYLTRVSDEGIGMSPEQVSRIFDKFCRADTSATAIGGLGLGMNIVQQIVKTHGGSIDVQSAPGEGTQVTIALPLGKPAELSLESTPDL